MTRVTCDPHLEVERSKIKITRSLWVAVQVSTCQGSGILLRPHYGRHSMLVIGVDSCYAMKCNAATGLLHTHKRPTHTHTHTLGLSTPAGHWVVSVTRCVDCVGCLVTHTSGMTRQSPILCNVKECYHTLTHCLAHPPPTLTSDLLAPNSAHQGDSNNFSRFWPHDAMHSAVLYQLSSVTLVYCIWTDVVIIRLFLGLVAPLFLFFKPSNITKFQGNHLTGC